ncbi:hypothetical protein GCM10028803_54230 [Larkinella knui]|uniref:Uncharacterized protein n=1 Tax=Larkinella knui TaxID=2025310 RepID=A0A3P1CG98_9BACT|nr:hypothetical protein [Larkinella knui]RRB12371.1 hypothetical protein EHT87_19425 [Larkinella knui]
MSVVPAIRSKYGFYRKLLREHKYVLRDTVDVVKLAGNPTFLEGKTFVSHIDLDAEITLAIRVKSNDHDFFRFELRCHELSDEPFFQFQSDGCTHRNADESIPLAQQRITTPHFSQYNQQGTNFTYKMEEATAEINHSMVYFCQEAKLNLRDDEFPVIRVLPNALPLHVTQKDPNSTVLFL